MKKKALGKGLNALISDLPHDILNEDDANNIKEIPLGQITPNPHQPRKIFDSEKLEELAQSIKENGVIQPILVTQKESNAYQIVVGERRYRAALKAGLKTLPCLVKELKEEKILELALIENLQREDLNPIETAQSYQDLINRFSFTQEELAQKVSKSRSAVTNTLRLLKLPQAIREDLLNNVLSEGHGRALLSLENIDEMLVLRDKIVQEKLSVRETENLVKQKPKTQKKQLNEPVKEDHIRDLESQLTHVLGTKVLIKNKGSKGKIEIEYYNLDDFDRIQKVIFAQKNKFWI